MTVTKNWLKAAISLSKALKVNKSPDVSLMEKGKSRPSKEYLQVKYKLNIYSQLCYIPQAHISVVTVKYNY